LARKMLEHKAVKLSNSPITFSVKSLFMLKALFLDMDETLCDTSGANKKAVCIMAEKADALLDGRIDSQDFGNRYLKGIYRELDARYSALLLPVNDEEQFRLALIKLILEDLGISDVSAVTIAELQETFDIARSYCFDFFPGIKELLEDLRTRFTLVVITNGPEFSQIAKINAVNLNKYVDHIIIGGQEKEQKPAVSIFEKALTLAQCHKDEVVHIGDSLKADVAGANNSGIVSVWISHGEELDETADIIPNHIIETPFQIRDLVNLLDSATT
jgi:N-acylneuraminate-9-phosphatase